MAPRYGSGPVEPYQHAAKSNRHRRGSSHRPETDAEDVPLSTELLDQGPENILEVLALPDRGVALVEGIIVILVPETEGFAGLSCTKIGTAA